MNKKYGTQRAEKQLESAPRMVLGLDGKKSDVLQNKNMKVNLDKIVIMDQVNLLTCINIHLVMSTIT